MQVVLLRVGIDTGSGGIHGPLFRDSSFEFIPIPDRFRGEGVDERTYGNTVGRLGHALVDYFPRARRDKVFNQSIHVDPDFATFTYGDPKYKTPMFLVTILRSRRIIRSLSGSSPKNFGSIRAKDTMATR